MPNRFQDVNTVQELIYHIAAEAYDITEAKAVATDGINRLGELLNSAPDDASTDVELNMEFRQFIRKPFIVEAVEVTRDNIAELSELIGEYGHDENGPYIEADRTKVPTVYRVTPGYWVTKMGKNVRCYSARVFAEQFTENTSSLDRLMRKIEEEGRVGRG